jgi:hypothetical protein
VSDTPEQNNANDGQSRAGEAGANLTAGLGAGVLIALNWGTSPCTAEVLANTGDVYFVEMDWGGRELMDMTELRRRKYVVLGRKRIPFWRRWFAPND